MADSTLTPEQLALGRALERVVVWLRQSRAASGVSATTLTTLNRLNDDGGLRITELAYRESVSQPAMSALVDRMEERGWAARTLDPSDRRATLVSITVEGRERVAASRRARAEAVGTRIAGLSIDDQRALTAALPALIRMSDTAPVSHGAPAQPVPSRSRIPERSATPSEETSSARA